MDSTRKRQQMVHHGPHLRRHHQTEASRERRRWCGRDEPRSRPHGCPREQEVVEEWERTYEVQDVGEGQCLERHVKRFKGRRKSVEPRNGNRAFVGWVYMQEQASDVAKRGDVVFQGPSNVFHGQRSNVVSGRVARVRERVLPGDKVGIADEPDGREDVFSAPGGPRFGNDGARFECVWLVGEFVDDVVPKLWRQSLVADHRNGDELAASLSVEALAETLQIRSTNPNIPPT